MLRSSATTFSAPETPSGILHAAMERFASHGYRRTSMDDIARSANVSRPTLYTYFANKKAILRAVSEGIHDQVHHEIDRVLATQAPIAERLRKAFDAWTRPYREILFGSEYGSELIGLSGNLASDIAEKSLNRFHQSLARHLTGAVKAGEVDLSRLELRADQVADYLIASVNGISSAAGTAAAHRRRISALVGTFVLSTTGESATES